MTRNRRCVALGDIRVQQLHIPVSGGLDFSECHLMIQKESDDAQVILPGGASVPKVGALTSSGASE